MLKHLRRAYRSLLRILNAHRKPEFPGWALPQHRPAWDNGINYDIPTYLRRRAG